jgi:hypothetical protein
MALQSCDSVVLAQTIGVLLVPLEFATPATLHCTATRHGGLLGRFSLAGPPAQAVDRHVWLSLLTVVAAPVRAEHFLLAVLNAFLVLLRHETMPVPHIVAPPGQFAS